MKASAILTVAGAVLASATPMSRRTPGHKQICFDISSNTTDPQGVKSSFSIPPACTVCDTLGIGCVAACAAGGPLDPACDFCAVGALGIVSQCIAVRNLPTIFSPNPQMYSLSVSIG